MSDQRDERAGRTEDERASRTEPHRWRVVRALSAVDSPVTIDRIVDEIAGDEAATDALAAIDTWDRIHEQLHDFDLPALDAAGLIDFDQERGVVSVPPEATDQFGRAVTEEGADTGESGIPWPFLYLSVAVIAAGLLAVVILQPGSGDWLPATLAMGATLALFGLVAVLHAVLG